MPDYGSSSYWDERYSTDEELYDWYQDYSSLEKYLMPYLPMKRSAELEILIPGCGNSGLGKAIHSRGFCNITNIDASPVVISQMADLHSDLEEMEYAVMDARNMPLVPDQCFDLIIDKALFDSLLCSMQNLNDAKMLLQEMTRVLRFGGSYIMISHGDPDSRMQLIKQFTAPCKMDVKVLTIPKPDLKDTKLAGAAEETRMHFMYVCTKLLSS